MRNVAPFVDLESPIKPNSRLSVASFLLQVDSNATNGFVEHTGDQHFNKIASTRHMHEKPQAQQRVRSSKSDDQAVVRCNALTIQLLPATGTANPFQLLNLKSTRGR